jgi:predicted SAM-dependent methyltransferase
MKKLNLGCGKRKQDGFINIDNRAEFEPDLICDIINGLPFEDDSVDMVLANDFL